MLRVDWTNSAAARYACENWHYSKKMPIGKMVKIGAFESEKFIGVILFSCGANRNIGRPYRLMQNEICELTRIALRRHTAPVSRILSVALKFIKKQSPGLKMVVSYADPRQGHHGGIYQATNWIYVGKTRSSSSYIYKGKELHKRQCSATGYVIGPSGKRVACPKFSECERVTLEGKHIYLFPLCDETKNSIKNLSKPYPKRALSIESDAASDQLDQSGATPTNALHPICKNPNS